MENKMDKKEIYEHYNLMLKLALQNNNKEVYDYNFGKLTSLLTPEAIAQFAMEDDIQQSFYQ